MVQATNNFVFVIRDEAEKEKSGLLLPDSGVEKPHHGTVYSTGELVRDKKIKAAKGKKICFHKGVGFPLEIEGEEYLILTDDQVIGVL